MAEKIVRYLKKLKKPMPNDTDLRSWFQITKLVVNQLLKDFAVFGIQNSMPLEMATAEPGEALYYSMLHGSRIKISMTRHGEEFIFEFSVSRTDFFKINEFSVWSFQIIGTHSTLRY